MSAVNSRSNACSNARRAILFSDWDHFKSNMGVSSTGFYAWRSNHDVSWFRRTLLGRLGAVYRQYGKSRENYGAKLPCCRQYSPSTNQLGTRAGNQELLTSIVP